MNAPASPPSDQVPSGSSLVGGYAPSAPPSDPVVVVAARTTPAVAAVVFALSDTAASPRPSSVTTAETLVPL